MPSSWREFVFDTFIGGYSSDLDPEMLPKNFLSAGQNIQYNKGLVSKRDGRQLFSAGPFTGTANGLWVFQLSGGTSYLLVVTTTNFYKYNVGAQTWTDITPVGGLHGTTTLAPQFITYNDKVYVTNGVDAIFYWDGVAANAVFVTGNGAPNACYAIMVFAGFFFAIRPTVGATLFGWRVMWSDFNNPTVFNSGQAGAVDLNDTAEQVMTAAVMGRWMSIYKTSTIYNTVFIGAPVYFDFRRIDTPGISLRRSLVQIPMLGLFGFGRDDAYIFDQNQSRPIGKPVRQEILTKINWQGADTANAWVRPDIGRVYFNVPFTATTPDNAYSYSYIDGQWMPEGPYVALAGIWAEFTSNLLVSQLTGIDSSYNLTIDQLTRLNQRQPLTTDGTYIYYHAAVANDYATPSAIAINSSLTTAETALLQQDGEPVPCTVYEIRVTANNVAGTVSVTLFASIGDGTYATYGPYTVTFTTSMVQRVPVEAYGERFSIKVANNNVNESFQVKQIALKYRAAAGRV
jgi:hypothetical protein